MVVQSQFVVEELRSDEELLWERKVEVLQPHQTLHKSGVALLHVVLLHRRRQEEE